MTCSWSGPPWTRLFTSVSVKLYCKVKWPGVGVQVSFRLIQCSKYLFCCKVMLKILQARLQQHMNRELPDVQAGFRKGRGTRDQIANIHWIIQKARVFQKKYLFLLYWLHQILWLCGHDKLENSERDGNTRPSDLPLEEHVCRSGSNS